MDVVDFNKTKSDALDRSCGQFGSLWVYLCPLGTTLGRKAPSRAVSGDSLGAQWGPKGTPQAENRVTLSAAKVLLNGKRAFSAANVPPQRQTCFSAAGVWGLSKLIMELISHLSDLHDL